MIRKISLFDEDGPEPPRASSNFKNYWMFPRAFRGIHNLPLRNALVTVNKILVGKKNSKDIENLFREEYNKLGAMSEAVDEKTGKKVKQKDIDTGTVRTVFAELKALGLIYEDNGGLYQFTQAGQDILRLNPLMERDSKKIDKIVLSVLMRHKFSSEYSRNPRVRIHPNIVVRPFVFLMKMFMDPRLGYHLSKSEMSIPIMLCKSLKDYELCVERVLEYRKVKNLKKVLGVNRIKNHDHSFHQILCSRSLIIEETGDRHTLNRDHPLLADVDKYVADYKEDDHDIMSTRDHGEYLRRRRVRNRMDMDVIMDRVRSMASMTSCKEELLSKLRGSVSARQMTKFRKALELIPENEMKDSFDANFLKYLGNPDEDINAEASLTSLMRRFEVESIPTGRKSNSLVRGNHSDTLVVCPRGPGIFDCKCNKAHDYRLPIGDHRAMKDYARSVSDLISSLRLDYEIGTKPSFVCFVSSDFHSNINKHLAKVKEETGIPASAISAHDLVKASRMGVTADQLEEVMCRGRLLTWEDFKPVDK